MQAATGDIAVGRSAALDESLQRAHKLAVAQGHGTVALEHLLFALTEDPEAVALLAASRTQLDRLRADTSGYLGQMTHALAGAPGKAPAPGQDLLRILQLAGLAARQSQRRQIDSAIVLAAIIGDGNSPAAGMLKAQGLTFEEVIRVLQQAVPPAVTAAPPQMQLASPPAPVPPAPPAATPPPPRPAVSDAENYLASARARVKQSEPPAHVSRAGHSPRPPVPPRSDPPTVPLTNVPAADVSLTTLPPATVADPAPPAVEAAAPAEALATFRPQAQVRPGPSPPPLPPAPPPNPPPLPPPAAPLMAAPVEPVAVTRAPSPPPATPALPPPLPPAAMAPSPPPLPPSPPSQMTLQPPPAARPQAPPPAPPPSMMPVLQPPPAAGPLPALLPLEPLNIVAAAAGLPAVVRVGDPVLVEIRVPRGEVDVPRATARPGIAPIAEPPVYRVVTARLSANTTAIAIEPRTPETVWLEPSLGPVADDVSWQFLLTPLRRGTIPVTLTIAGRSISAYGVMADKTSPTETFAVTVKRAPGALSRRFLKGLALLIVGGVVTWAVLGPLALPISRLWAAALG
jgi:hypothetical protein